MEFYYSGCPHSEKELRFPLREVSEILAAVEGPVVGEESSGLEPALGLEAPSAPVGYFGLGGSFGWFRARFDG
jgi:hypothetical protein